MPIVRFDSLESTNKYCEALDLAQVGDFTCYWAIAQTAGIGQRGNCWASAPGENLTFSLVLHPSFLPADRQFRLTQALSLAICDFLSTFHFPFSTFIKWPNDIYVSGRKICGTLISAHISPFTSHLSTCICGIGLNVNQREFPDWVPNPTSLSLLTGREWPLEELLTGLLAAIQARYEELRRDPPGTLDAPYLARLLRRGEKATYLYQGQTIEATITGVNRFGHLQLVTPAGEALSCQMKEIQFL